MLTKVIAAFAVVSSCLFAVPLATPAEAAAAPGARCTITGTPRADLLRGTPGPDVICGLGGDDRLVGLGGDDVLRGGPGDDVLVGDAGDDVLKGGTGDDVLRGTDGPAHEDVLACGPGRDQAFADRRHDRVQPSCERIGGEHDPTGITLTPSAVDENEPAGTVVGRLAATDPDEGDRHDFELLAGDDSFRIVGRRLVTTRVLDHESDPTLDVRVRVSDQTDRTLTGVLTVLVTDVDDPPTAVDDEAAVVEDSGATPIDVLANDTDVDAGPIAVGSVTQAAHGTVAITGGGAGLTYRPDADFCGTAAAADTFTYALAPGGSTATVRVEVTCTPDGPVAVDDAATVAEDAAATAIPVLANDTSNGFSLSIATVTQPAGGTVVITGGGTGLTYAPDADACTTGTPDSFTYTLAGGGTAAVAVTVTCAPDAPVLETSSGATAYTEGDAATAVDTGLTVVDVDPDGAVSGATVEITSGYAAGQDVLALPGSHPGISAAYAGGTLTLTGSASDTAYQAALRAVTYANTSDDPSTSDRVLTFEVTDEASLSDSATKTVSVAAVNDAPALDPTTGNVSYTEGGTAATLAGTITVSDPDDTTLASATLVIASGRQGGDLLGFADTAAVEGTFTAGTGTLVLEPAGASASLAEFQAALRSVTFSTTNDDPTTSRSVELTVDDGDADSSVASRSVTITPTNDAPEVSNTAGTVTVEEDDADGKVVDATLSVSDPDDVELVGASVEIAVGRQVGDSLTFAAQSGITGVYSTTTGTLALSGTATVAQYRDALRSVRFVVAGDDPVAAARTVRFTVDDGDTTATSAGRSVAVQPVNDAPVLTAPASIDADEDTAEAVSDVSIADVDAGTDDLEVTLSVDHGALTLGTTTDLDFTTGDGTSDATMVAEGTLAELNTALATLSYRSDLGYDGADSLAITVDDLGHRGSGGALTDTAAVPISLNHLNRAPVNNLPAAQTMDEDDELELTGGDAISITDVDAGSSVVEAALAVDHGTLTLSQTTGLTFLGGADGTSSFHVAGTLANINAALAGLTYAPDADYAGSDTLSVDSDDRGHTGVGGSKSDSDTLAITVAAVNDEPTAHAPTSATVAEDGTLGFSGSAALTVADVDAGAGAVTVEVTVTHGVFTLGGTTGVVVGGDGSADVTLSGTVAAVNTALAGSTYQPAADYNGPARLDLDVDDNGNTGLGGAQEGGDFTSITVTAVNDAPVLTAPATASVDQNGSRTFPGTISVADVDAASGELEVTLAVDHGSLTLATTVGLSFATGDGGADSVMVFTGFRDFVNAALDGLVYTPTTGYHGTDQLDIAVDDQGHTGSGGSQTDSASVAITVNAVNTAPVNTVPGPQVVTEDGSLTFSGSAVLAVSDADVDDATGELGIDLDVDHGTLTLAGTTGLDFTTGDGSDDAALAFTGSPDAINDALDGATYEPDPNYHGSDTLALTTDDLGVAGPPGALSTTDTVGITVTSVNDDPVLTTPASVATDEDTDVAVTGISVADVDAGSGDLEIALSVTHGTLTLGTTTGLAFISGDGTDDASIDATGTLADINAALDTLSYLPAANYSGSDALGVFASDGISYDDATIPVTVTAVDDAPVNTLPSPRTIDEDTTLTLGGANAISVADVDNTTLRVTLTPTHGVVTLADDAGVTFTAGDGVADTLVTFSGTKSAVNDALDGLSYVPASDYNGPAKITVATTDLSLTATDDLDITVTAVNDAPVNAVPGAQTIDEETATDIDGVSIADVDAGTDDLEIALDVDHGTLTLGTTTGLSFTTGDGSGDAMIVATGPLARLNAALATLSYEGGAAYDGPDTLTLTTDDLGHTGSGGAQSDADTVDITVQHRNRAPVNTLPGAQTVDEDTTLTLGGANAISVADPDATDLQVTLTTSDGTVTLDGTTGLAFEAGDGTADAVVTFAGTKAAVNAALDGLTYDPVADENGAETITVLTSDLGATGTGGTKTDSDDLDITVTAVNDAPVATAPATATLEEDGSLALTGANALSVSDVDATSLEISVEVSSGDLTDGVDSSDGWTTSGGVAGLNSLLESLTYVPEPDFAGPVDLVLEVSDNGSTGSGGAKSDTATTAITVTAVNDAPEITAPASVSADQDTAKTIAGVSITDVDSGSDDLSLSLSVDHGTVTLGTTGLSFTTGDGTDDATIVAEGTRAALNAALASLSYTGAGGYRGADALEIDIDDQGHTGSGGAKTDSASVSITVAAVNTAPVNTVPGAQTIDEDTTLTFTGGRLLAVSDVDVDDATGQLEVDLDVDHGTLTLAGTTGLDLTTGDGTDDAQLVFTGTPDDINAALDGATYRPETDYAGADTLTLVTDDLGVLGSPGALTDTDTVAITITAVNDVPSITAPASFTTAEDTPADVTGLSVADPDAGSDDLDLYLGVGSGTLTLGTSAGLDFTTGDGTADSSVVATGTLAEINAALATLSYAPSADENGPDTLSIAVDDGHDTGDVDVPITVTAVNDAPVNSLPGAQSVVEDTILTLGGGDAISVEDVDATSLQVSLTATHGTVSLGGTTGLDITTGDGTDDAVVVFSGATAAVNAALDGLAYQPDNGYVGAAKITVLTSDEGATGTGGTLTDSDDLAITVLSANAAPEITAPASATVLEDATLAVSGVSVDDADVGADDLDISLGVDHGTLTLGTVTGLDFTTGDGTADATIVATGTLSDLNTALATLSYAPTADYDGSDTLAIGITDGIDSDDADVSITVTGVNDAPSFTKGADQFVDNKTESGDPVPYAIIPWATAISAGPGESGQSLTFEVSNDHNTLFTDQPAVSSSGVLTFTPDTAQVGTATVTVRLKDDGGTADGGVDTSADQTFTITTAVPGPRIDSISPATLVPGATATLTGRRFSATPASNTVTIGGVAATVTAASTTELSVTVPCASSGSGVPVKVRVGSDDSNIVNQALQVANVRTLGVGDTAFITDPTQVWCNELASANGTAKYVIAAYSASTSPGSNSPFQFSADTSADGPGDSTLGRASLVGPGLAGPGPEAAPDAVLGEQGDGEADPEMELTRKNRQMYQVLKKEFGTDGVQHRRVARRAATDLPMTRNFRISNINGSNICNSYYVASATRVYAEGKLVIYEDDATPTAFKAANNSEMAAYYEQIGDQFNSDMEPIIRDNFGNILRRDAETDNNGVMIALSTPRINNTFSGVAGFVVTCDQFPNDDASSPAVGGPYAGSGTNGASNFGEYFYMYQPVTDADGYSGNTPDNWYRTIRSTFIHESKHVASQAARVANNAPVFEAGWLEEGTARMAEELWAREVVYDLPWKGNNGYGSASNPGNIYCDVRPTGFSECDAIPRTPVSIMQRHFTSLYTTMFGTNARLLSPFGATPSDNASYYYAESWSLVRYAIDHYGTSDADFLTALTNSTTAGATNLADRAGVSIDRLLGGWNLSLVVDDLPGATVPAEVQVPTWNLRSIYAGLNTDFPSTYTLAYPAAPTSLSFGTFSPAGITTLRGGGSLWYQISGTQTAPQLLRMQVSGAPPASNTSLRLAVVRVQ